jgi:pyruvate dehydrogenase E1 component beta subunit
MGGTAQKNINFVKAINLAMHDALAADPSVFLMGEDIADPEDGGVWKATAGLSTKFGVERVRSTPIAEEGFVAAGIGAAQAGLRPVVEVMLMGFITVAKYGSDPQHGGEVAVHDRRKKFGTDHHQNDGWRGQRYRRPAL